jgi:hypothetical protein
MTKHIYTVGQHVSFDGRAGTSFKRAGVFTITKLLPPVGVSVPHVLLCIWFFVIRTF